MKRNALAIMLCLFLFSACGLSPEAIAKQTATAATAIAASQTKTATPTATPTGTPTATFTPSPIPTLLGGGSGRLLFFRDSNLYSFDITHETGEIVLTQQQLMEAMEIEKLFVKSVIRNVITGFVSPDGKKILIWACGDENCTYAKTKFALATTDLSYIKILSRFQDFQWSTDSQKLLFQPQSNEDMSTYYIIDLTDGNFGRETKLDKAYIRSATISPDSKQVYYTSKEGYNVINTDGSNKQTLTCDVCKSSTRSVLIAISPDGQKVAIAVNYEFDNLPDTMGGMISTSQYHIVITNRDFSSPKVLPPSIIRFGREAEILWLPDNENIIFLNSEYDLAKQPIDLKESKDVIQIVNVVNGETRDVTSSPQPSADYDLCGSSPDGNLITKIVSSYSVETETLQFFIYIQDLETNNAYRLTSFDVGTERRCPTWLP